MTPYIDRDAGFATFRHRRSLCVRLDGELDLRMATGILEQIRGDRESVRLRLECSTLGAVQPRAARVLAGGLLAWAQQRANRWVEILNLDLELQRRVAWHPLRTFTDPDEMVFTDPDRSEAWGAAPSRH